MAIEKFFGLVVLLLAVESGRSFQLIPPMLFVVIDYILENPEPMPLESLGPHRASLLNFAKEEDNIQGAFNLWNRPGLRYLVDLMFITAAKNDSEIVEWAREKNLPIATDDTDISEYIKERCLPSTFGKRTGPIVPKRRTVTVPYAPDGFDEELWKDQYRKMEYGDITVEEFDAYEEHERARVDSEAASKQALLDAITKYVTSKPESTTGTSISSQQALLDAVTEYVTSRAETVEETTPAHGTESTEGTSTSSQQALLDAVTEYVTSRAEAVEETTPAHGTESTEGTITSSQQALLDAVTEYVTSRAETGEETTTPAHGTESTEGTITSSHQALLDAVTEYVTSRAETVEETTTAVTCIKKLLDSVVEYAVSNAETMEQVEAITKEKQALLDAITEYVTSRAKATEETVTATKQELLDAVTEYVTNTETTEETSTMATTKQALLDAITEYVTSRAETTEETSTSESGSKQALLDAIAEYVTSRAQTEETSTPASNGKRALLDAITELLTSRPDTTEESSNTAARQDLLDAVTELVTSNAETTEETMDTSDKDETYQFTTEDIFQSSEGSDLETTEAEVTTIAHELRTLLAEQKDELKKQSPLLKRAKDDSSESSFRQGEFLSSRDMPSTSFTCADKPQIPGFYADMDTGCQVFHVCYPHRTESFLCPVGTIFNQERIVCDHWYSVDCTRSPAFYQSGDQLTRAVESNMDWTKVHQFLPVNSRVHLNQKSSNESSNDVLEDKESKANDVLKGLEKMSALLSEDVSADTVWKMTENYSKLAKFIEE